MNVSHWLFRSQTLWNYLLSNIVAFVVGLSVNYALSTRWVFGTRNVRSPLSEFLVFGLVGVAGLGLSEAVMFVGVGVLGQPYQLAKIAAVGVGFFWNFGARKALLFRNRPPGEPPSAVCSPKVPLETR